MTTLIECLNSNISYDDSWAVYAEKIDGKFMPESLARFGQRQFENGGLLDDCEFFASNTLIVDFINDWAEGDASAEQEAAEMMIDEENTSN